MYWKRGPAGSCLLRRPAEDLELRGFLSRRAFVRPAAGCRALVIVNKIVLLKLSPEIVDFFFFFFCYIDSERFMLDRFGLLHLGMVLISRAFLV